MQWLWQLRQPRLHHAIDDPAGNRKLDCRDLRHLCHWQRCCGLSTGQLGVTVSSERYKTGITAMGANTAKLGQLRPVMFHLKTDPEGALQYGLIAEEVAKVYPELVIRDGSGRIDGVRYDELAPMLLNEVQKQQRINEAQVAEMSDLKLQVLKDLKQELRGALLKLRATDDSVAQR